ncbi:ABC transporter substrate-binding protein [Micromonospora carbonacea]|uniref:ABC transporter substrate-binding protein n=1 Tax=Micromonospora carbonacea TaxID=47853 RepID=A0A7H8XJJ8_9ACTN|nr:ABC transporter substrate-binding protein [Micromonospora carbonacea]MBB5826938.1 hypothetical protein [Micromonospora carbonacea]QLD25227.1 ABC transporter substrate-binding protein [Micromonospora carbonacea]
MADERVPEQGRRAYAEFHRLVELIESMVLRPARRGWRLPLLCLVSRPGTPSPLAMLAHVFAGEERRVPHVRLDATGRDVRALLHEAYTGLVAGNFGGADRLAFRHYALADGLMQVDLTGVATNRRRRELTRQLRERISQRAASGGQQAPPDPGGWLGVLLWFVLRVLPGVTFWLLTNGWLLGAGRRFRWFLRQQYLAPELAAGDFVAFASRLTVPSRETEDQEQIDLLLVHAFLQDLRVEHRRRPWRLRPWRRTACPVLLLDGLAPGNGGYALVRLINAVRDETGRSDPLLVISNGHDVPPDGLSPTDPAVAGQLVPLDGVEGAYRAWRSGLPRARRAREDNAWYLQVEVPAADLTPFRNRLSRIVPPRPPWLARPVALVALVAVVLTTFGVWQIPGQAQRWRADCEWPPSARGGGLVHTAVRDGQCIGYSDHGRQLFSRDESLLAVQRQIFDQNREVEAAWAVRRDRPRVTLVYFGSLTKPDALPGEETFAGEREELQGMAAAQRRAYLEANDDRANPYLRIVVANAGQEMRYAGDVVRMLADLARDEPTVLGVVGLVESRKAVQDAIKALGDLNLPVLAPTLSADRIADASSRYLQISAPNIDEATLVHDHVTEVLKKKRIFNFYTYGNVDPDVGAREDLYVNTLRDGLRSRFGGDAYQETYWRQGVDLTPVCADRFGDGVVFFGGRYTEFGAFAARLAENCSGRVPLLIGDDSVNRYLANTAARRPAPDNLPLAYVVKGELAYCHRILGATDIERKLFLTDVRTVLSLCQSNSHIGERVGLAYDATRLHLRAVRTIAGNLSAPAGREWNPREVTPTTVYVAIRDVADPAYQGVTGLIRFDANGIAVGKRLTLLCVPDIRKAFDSPSDVPREIDRHPIDPAENKLYGTPPPDRRACTTQG